MQSTPSKLIQTIWSAFRAAKPVHHGSIPRGLRSSHQPLQLANPCIKAWQNQSRPLSRLYSDSSRTSETIEKQVQDAKDRIHSTIESRADIAADTESPLKNERDETIVHTIPESASIVYTKGDNASTNQQSGSTSSASSQDGSTSTRSPPADLPSQIAALRSKASERFTYFMDNLQSQIFVASRRINDLTGYSGIERLKKEIEAQESSLQEARQAVKDSRAGYSAAIENRSATQREVNDLLHRKHAWSPSDLERFTNLYRSDHVNEQAEQKAHQKLSEAESQYEDASTKLAKSILARYHEEQIWSDKIRQMSTWGTWGLMGLNILLFIVLQLAIEPWRRRRLVRGFEQKVAEALTLREEGEANRAQRNANEIVSQAAEERSEGVAALASARLAETVVDAITGASEETANSKPLASTEEIAEAVEQVTTHELAAESAVVETVASVAETVPEEGTPDVLPVPTDLDGNTASSPAPDTSGPSTSLPSWSRPFAGTSAWTHLPVSLYNTIKNLYAEYSGLLVEQFNETHHVVLSKRELTTRILESAAAGVALAGGLFFVIARSR